MTSRAPARWALEFPFRCAVRSLGLDPVPFGGTGHEHMMLSLACVTFVVRDYDEAIDFFTRVIGFTLVEDTPLENGKRWVIVAPPDGRTSLLLARAAAPRQEQTVGNQAGGRVAFFLHTDEFRRAYDTLRGRGVEFVEEPRHESYGTVAVFTDLYGNRWDLVEPASRTAASVAR